MNRVLILGQGAREHAVGWKLAQDGTVELYFGPGNAGTAEIGTNLDFLNLEDPRLSQEVLRACRGQQIDLVTVTNEDLLARGLVDDLTGAGIAAFGPTKKAAKIESSKVWANIFLDLYKLPHAKGLEYRRVAGEFVLPAGFRVVKADGLARGKGVKIAKSSSEVPKVVDQLRLEQPSAAAEILIQEFLAGQEVSIQAFSDGREIILLPLAVDYKRISEGNRGENSGGVGSYSSKPWFTRKTENDLITIMEGLVQSLAENGNQFRGVIYGGFVLTTEGPKLIEVNSRLGDPETQVVLPRMRSKLLPILQQSTAGWFEVSSLEWDRRVSVCVVLCSEGYPGNPIVNRRVHGLDNLPKEVLVFHGGTTRNKQGEIITSGGRVLSIVAMGDTLEEARRKVYEAISQIHFEGMYCRRDIATES